MNEELKATIFIIDDDDAIRGGLSMLLQSFDYDTRSFPSGTAFLEHCAEHPVPERCMAILDLSMPVMDGLAVQAELQRRAVNIPVVFLSGDGDIPVAVHAVRHGAVDFIEKPVVTDVLVERIERALQLRASGDREPGPVAAIRSYLADLTRRERDVLEGIAEGKTSKAIAAGLGISERTVELHRSLILRKMGVRNSTELLNNVIPALRTPENGND